MLPAFFQETTSGDDTISRTGSLPVRTYLSYFLKDGDYVRDDSPRQSLYADTSYYDAPGREYLVMVSSHPVTPCVCRVRR